MQYLLQALRLAVATGGRPWLVMNAAMAAWNTYLPLMQRECYADLACILLPVLQQLLQVGLIRLRSPWNSKRDLVDVDGQHPPVVDIGCVL